MKQTDTQFFAQKIRARYLEKSHDELDALRRLDAKIHRPAAIFAYLFGGVGALVMGCGMSLVMTDLATLLSLGDMMIPGIVIGLVGMAMAAVNYPIYRAILRARKKKYGAEVLALTENILNA